MAAKKKASRRKGAPKDPALDLAAARAKAAREAEAKGGIALDPNARADQLLQQLQGWMQQTGAAVVSQHRKDESGNPMIRVMPAPDGGLIIQLPPPTWGVAVPKERPNGQT